MAESRNRSFAKLAKDVDTSGNIVATGISSSVSLGATIYASGSNLPTSGNTAGDQAFTTDTNRLYIWNGSGWYNVALLNVAPSIQSVLDSNNGTTPFALSIDGSVTTITITAADSDGDPITYAASADSNFTGLGTISQADNVFTITPFSSDSATTTLGTITFTATDGVNIASSGIQTFTLNFLSPYWDETVLSVGTTSTNGATNGSIVDNSDNAFTFTKAGTPTLTAFNPYLDNWSVEFDGTGDYLNVPTSTDFALTADFTIEAWCNFNSIAASSYIIDCRANSTDGSNNSVAIAYSSGTGKFVVNAGGVTIITGTTTIAANTWYHVAAVRNGSTITLYVNGASDGTATNSTSFTNYTNRPIIGSFATGSAAFMNGFISNLRIVKGTALYISNFTPSTENLTAVTNTILLTCQSNRFIDNSSNGYTLTVAGNPEIYAFNPFGQESEYAPGANKGSAEFKSGESLTRATTGFYTVSSFCMEFWIYPLSDTTHYICEGTQQGSATWRITLDSSTGYVAFAYAAGSWAGVNFNTGTGHYNSGEWTHIAITKNSSGVFRIFVNGTQQGTQTNTSALTNTARNFQFGYYVDGTGTYYSDALFSDFKITRQDPVYESNFSVPTSPVGGTNSSVNDPYMYLPFDDVGIFDKTGNHTLTLAGNTVTSTTKTKHATTSMRVAAANDYIITNGLAMGGYTDMTIEGWFNFDFTNSNVYIAGHNTTYAANNNMYQLGLSSGRVAWWIGGSLPSTQYDPNTLSTDTWYHLAWVKDGTSYKIYKDGTQVASFTNTATIQSHEWRVGNTYDGTSQGMTGYIEDFQILNYAKYTANFTPPTQTQGRIYQAES